jgi:hypothetical protein
MRSLGRPNREQVVTVRPTDLTTLQALDLANGQTLTTTLTTGATNILKANPMLPPDALIERLFRQAVARVPTPDEQKAALELLGPKPTKENLADLLWAILMLPEFQLLR